MIIRPLSLLASALVCLVTSVQASPITYDFGGTLAQPYKGSSLFSGSFSLESSTAGFDGGKLVSGYAGASASLTIGGQTFRFQNIMIEDPALETPSNQSEEPPASGINSITTPTAPVTRLTCMRTTESTLVQPAYPWPTMTIHLADPTGTALLPSDLTLPSLDLNRFSVRQFGFSPSPDAPAMLGTITSLQAVPEPSHACLRLPGRAGPGFEA